MRHEDCVVFLKWAMPRLGLSWPGFAHCHRQVCKRIHRRSTELGLPDFAAYRDYVLDHDTEWEVIDSCCRVTVSRFYRDAEVFDRIKSNVLPRLAHTAQARGDTVVRAWSAGCGAGEEPFSIALAWHLGPAARTPGLRLEIVATDIDDKQLARARGGCYRPASLRELPPDWVRIAFLSAGALRCLRPEYQQCVEFLLQDIRANAPKGPFDLILCRNLAFTYFDAVQQRAVLAMLSRELAPSGVLVIGRRERLPDDGGSFAGEASGLGIFRKSDDPSRAHTAAVLPASAD